MWHAASSESTLLVPIGGSLSLLPLTPSHMAFVGDGLVVGGSVGIIALAIDEWLDESTSSISRPRD